MFVNSTFEKIVSKTINKCLEKGIITNEEEVKSIIFHIIDKTEYFFNMNKQGLMSIGSIEFKGLGKFLTKGEKERIKKQKLKKSNPDLYNERYVDEKLTVIKL